jgi:glycerol uptake facilitator-like aquaporin
MTSQRALVRMLVAELIGTFALVFAGCGAIMVDAKTHALGHVGVALSFGLVIMVMIYAVGHISGAHFNGAVTFAFALSRHFPWPRAVAYWTAQLLGALAAAAILRGSLGNIADSAAYDALREALMSKDAKVRRAAAEALGERRP